jgi:hypothetical protein
LISMSRSSVMTRASRFRRADASLRGPADTRAECRGDTHG